MKAVWVLALATWREHVRQPVFLLLLLCAGAMVFLVQYITFFTLGLETLTVLDMGLSTLTLAACMVSVFCAWRSLHHEIESRSIINLLSKPISRPGIVLGKFLGVLLALLVLHVLLGGVLLLAVYSSSQWHEDVMFSGRIIYKCINLVAVQYLHAMVMAAAAVCFSTVFAFPVTALCVSVVFFAGHLKDYLTGHLEQAPAWTQAVWRAAHVLLPNLQHHHLMETIYTDLPLTARYLVLVSAESVLYAAVFLLAATAVFCYRDVR